MHRQIWDGGDLRRGEWWCSDRNFMEGHGRCGELTTGTQIVARQGRVRIWRGLADKAGVGRNGESG